MRRTPRLLPLPGAVVGAAFVVGHVAGTVAGYGGVVDPVLLRTWLRRTSALGAVAPAALARWVVLRLGPATPDEALR